MRKRMTAKIELSFNKTSFGRFFTLDTWGDPNDPRFMGKVIVVFDIPAEIEAKILAHTQGMTKSIKGDAELVQEKTGHKVE